MANNTTSSIRLSDDFRTFVNRLKFNRIKADVDQELLSSAALCDTIVKYFKVNNDRYLELVSLEEQNV